MPVIRALRSETISPDAISQLRGDYVLLDSYDPVRFGGTGRALRLDDLKQIDLSRVLIAGGLVAETVGDAAALNPWGVDVASGIETSPGVKDHAKMRSFIANAKRAG